MSENKQLDFTGKVFFIGIDVHKRQWTIAIRLQGAHLKTFKIKPSPTALYLYMVENYPGGSYRAVYEAGFCGFWPQRQLAELGIDTILVNPSDVPTTQKERQFKDDCRDAIKLARELEKGDLKALYIPDVFHQQLRSLSRMRHRLVQRQTACKNRIKKFLDFNGIHIPEDYKSQHWSHAFLNWLDDYPFEHPPAHDYMDSALNQLRECRCQLASVTKQLRAYCKDPKIKPLIYQYLLSVPGIAFKSAITLYCEIIDIRRFRKGDELFLYAGLAPGVYSSDENETITGLTKRCNRYIRHIIIESAWVAMRHDPALSLAYQEYCQRMKPQKAIIRIARKLLNRIRYVWINETTYQKGVIQ